MTLWDSDESQLVLGQKPGEWISLQLDLHQELAGNLNPQRLWMIGDQDLKMNNNEGGRVWFNILCFFPLRVSRHGCPSGWKDAAELGTGGGL